MSSMVTDLMSDILSNVCGKDTVMFVLPPSISRRIASSIFITDELRKESAGLVGHCNVLKLS